MVSGSDDNPEARGEPAPTSATSGYDSLIEARVERIRNHLKVASQLRSASGASLADVVCDYLFEDVEQYSDMFREIDALLSERERTPGGREWQSACMLVALHGLSISPHQKTPGRHFLMKGGWAMPLEWSFITGKYMDYSWGIYGRSNISEDRKPIEFDLIGKVVPVWPAVSRQLDGIIAYQSDQQGFTLKYSSGENVSDYLLDVCIREISEDNVTPDEIAEMFRRCIRSIIEADDPVLFSEWGVSDPFHKVEFVTGATIVFEGNLATIKKTKSGKPPSVLSMLIDVVLDQHAGVSNQRIANIVAGHCRHRMKAAAFHYSINSEKYKYDEARTRKTIENILSKKAPTSSGQG